jgi:ABC-2 type transport system permease protein
VNGLWCILRQEYRKKIRQPRFWGFTLGMPLALGVMLLIFWLANFQDQGVRAVGYFDAAGTLGPAQETRAGRTHILVYSNLETAKQALMAGKVRAVYDIPVDYLQGGKIQMYQKEDLPIPPMLLPGMQVDFERFLRARLLERAPTHPPADLFERPQVVARAFVGSRQFNPEDLLNLFAAFLVAIVFLNLVSMTSSTLLNGITSEKANRTLEIVITSVSPEQLLAGKALGLLGVCLTQVVVWVLLGLVVAGVGLLRFPALRQVPVPWQMLVVLGLFFLPSYALIASVMTGIGGLVNQVRQAQQIASVVNVLFIGPMALAALLMVNPDGRMAVFLTIFPTTALSTIALRWVFGGVPAWQLLASWSVLVVCTLVAVWASARLFRLGMVLTGQRPSLRAALAELGSLATAARNISR